MTFDYNTLKRAARDGSRLGNWNGKVVFAASADSLENKGSGAYYILYDDENRIVAKTNSGWKSFGEVSMQGSVNEYSSARNYRLPHEKVENYTRRDEPVTSTYSPGYDVSERPVGDVKAEIDVEKVLKSAREMSVESLLDGFLVGVDFSVAKG